MLLVILHRLEGLLFYQFTVGGNILLKVRSVRFQNVKSIVAHGGRHRCHLVLQNKRRLHLLSVHLRQSSLIRTRAIVKPREVLNLRRQIRIAGKIINFILIDKFVAICQIIMAQISLVGHMGFVL